MACSFSAAVRLMPSWTRWKTSRSAAGERWWYSTVGVNGVKCVCAVCGGGLRTTCDEFLGECPLLEGWDLGA